MLLGQLDSHIQKNKVGPVLHTVYKNLLKKDPDIKIRDETLKGKSEVNLCDFGLGNSFWNVIPTESETKVQVNILEYIKTKDFCVKIILSRK